MYPKHNLNLPLLFIIFYSSKVKEVGQVKRYSRGTVTAAATPAPTPAPPEPRGRDNVHRSRERALSQHSAGSSALHNLTSTHAFPCYDP